MMKRGKIVFKANGCIYALRMLHKSVFRKSNRYALIILIWLQGCRKEVFHAKDFQHELWSSGEWIQYGLMGCQTEGLSSVRHGFNVFHFHFSTFINTLSLECAICEMKKKRMMHILWWIF